MSFHSPGNVSRLPSRCGNLDAFIGCGHRHAESIVRARITQRKSRTTDRRIAAPCIDCIVLLVKQGLAIGAGP